jgi:Ca2+ transporting ATPase
MFKHIIGQTIYQFAVLLVLIFYGENFLPEYQDSFDEQLVKDNAPHSYKYNYVNGHCKFKFKCKFVEK